MSPFHALRTTATWALAVLALLPSPAALPAGRAVVAFEPAPASIGGWVARAKARSVGWHVTIARRLGRPSPDGTIAVGFSPDASFVARTASGRILVSSAYLERNPDDLGLLAHEMVHVVQAYPRTAPGWLTEGIADYIRYYGIEPRSRRAGFDPQRQSFLGGYQAAAFLLRALERERGCGAINRLDSALRSGEDVAAVWFSLTGRTAEQFWRDLIASREAVARIGRPDPSPCFRS